MKKFFLIFAFLWVLPLSAKAQTSSIIINEIAWMGTAASANEEWIELKNTTQNPISLERWLLQSSDRKLIINLKGTIGAQGYFLLKRNAAQNSLSAAPDLVYTGALNNNGMNLLLYDNTRTIIDEVFFLSKWTEGNNDTKRTAEKTPTGWQSSKDPGGTPKEENSAGHIKPVVTPKLSTLPKAKKPANSKEVNTEVAAVNKNSQLPSDPFAINPWWLLGISLTITIISAAILLIYTFHVRS